MLHSAQDPGAPAAVLDHRKDVQLGATEQVSGEEGQRKDPLRLRLQKARTGGGPYRRPPPGIGQTMTTALQPLGA
jgi:hypothetical protein